MSAGPIRRTTHACVQCRERKQKCGGVTSQATCIACQARKVDCSFEEEARDPRYNPYLRIQSTRSPDRSIRVVEREREARGESSQAENGKDAEEVQNQLQLLRDEIQTLRGTLMDRQVTQILQNTSIPGPSTIFPPPPQEQPVQTDQAIFSDPSPTYFDPPSATHSVPAQSLPSIPLSHTSPDAAFNGPMKVLQELGADDAFDVECHDPITRQILTQGEASVAFRLFFNKCHLNAPFLDSQYDGDLQSVRSRNAALFLNIIVVGARFWSHSSKRDTWLHPRYPRLVALLDQEMSRLTLRPRPADICLETVQAWMIYSHWMPIDTSSSINGTSYRSRFTESSVWQCLGLAIRWVTLLGLDKTAHLPFIEVSNTPSGQDVRNYRTMLYLTESDHYLAMSARRPPTLLPTAIYSVLPRFLRGDWVRPTDSRLASLIRVVQAAHVMGGKAETVESLEAFNEDVNGVEQSFLSWSAGMEPGHDRMGQHFPFTSLRWYRLAFASTLLPPPGNWRNAGEMLRLSVDWASQMLYHLSSSAPMTSSHLGLGVIEGALEPDEGLVKLLSFAIDQYFVVM
nr:uncharacterized protein CI109_000441 [Kwoniella shandongensis]KAA5530871.1 hypothetical protein CI109_000441 [Kwoniella shandongensis]